MIFKRCCYRAYQYVLTSVMHIIKYNNKIISAERAVYYIPEILKKHGASGRVLIITGPHIARTGLFSKITRVFREKGVNYVIFSGTSAEAGIDSIEYARKLYFCHKCCAIVAIGGGSVIDCAKAAAAGIASPGKKISSLEGYQKSRKKIPLLIAVPSTAGTGAETTACAVIKDVATGNKKIIADTNIMPKFAVLDPVMTRGLPSHMVAYSGMDALTHATESYLNKYSFKSAEKDAEMAVKLIAENITKVYYGTGSSISRQKMLEASYLAGRAFLRKSVGYVHAIGHAIGGQYNIAHGMAVAVVLPYVLQWYGKCVYKKLAKLADICGIADENLPESQKAGAYINYIKMLTHKLGIYKDFCKILKKEDITRKDVKNMAKCAIIESNPHYPVPKIMSLKECEYIIYSICTISYGK
ncbi:MAG: iron-containing alcohol dehydrogenase [Lachnospiraceae bacterium]|nr:iron-containing alcohol dehydrogenase [Lachnospiraceae bacterium]